MKKIISAILALVLALGLASTAAFAIEKDEHNIMLTTLPDEHNVMLTTIPEEHNVMLTVSKDGSPIGREINNAGIVNYVSDDGTTSVVIEGSGITWLKEEILGTSSWYGIDNSEGLFKTGSIFWVRALDKMEDPEEYDRILKTITFDNDFKVKRVLQFGIDDPEGNPYTESEVAADLYLEVGNDWNKSDIQSKFIGDRFDESVKTNYVLITGPEGKGEFCKLTMNNVNGSLFFGQMEAGRFGGLFATIFNDYQPITTIVLIAVAAIIIGVVIAKKRKQ